MNDYTPGSLDLMARVVELFTVQHPEHGATLEYPGFISLCHADDRDYEAAWGIGCYGDDDRWYSTNSTLDRATNSWEPNGEGYTASVTNACVDPQFIVTALHDAMLAKE